jgi:chromosome partitioning protein
MIHGIKTIPGSTMRTFQGIRPKLAQELSGFNGTPKMFRTRFREADDGATKLYTASQMRDIRMKLLNIPVDTVRPKTLPPIIDARMAKGGVGKTTTVGNIGPCLALSGYRVLMIDGDPQASLTGMFGINWVKEKITHISELMKRSAQKLPVRPEEAIWPLYDDGMLDIIPSDITMSDDSWLAGVMNREQAFVRFLESEVDFFSRYDVIIIDSAPGASLLATTFMVACKTLLAVVTPEGQALAALDILASNVYEINKAFEKQKLVLDVHIVVNQYNQSKKPHNVSLAKLIAKYPNKLNDTIIRDFVGFLRETDPDNLETNGPVLEKEPNSVGARDIIDLTKSLIKLYGIRLAGTTPAGLELEDAQEAAA